MAGSSIFKFFIRANVQNIADVRKLGNALQGVQGKAKNLARTLGSIKSPFKELLALGGIAGAGAFIATAFGSAAEIETLRTSIETLTGDAEKAVKVVRELSEFSQATPFSGTELITVAERLKAFGVETDKVIDTTKRLADAAAANNVDLKRLGNTYGQVFAKGKFVQEENLQLLGQGVNVTEELKDMYGLTGKELEEAMKKGRVPAEALEVALARMTAQSGEFFQGAQAQSQTLQGRLRQLQGTWGNVMQAIGQTLEPLFKRLLVAGTLILQTIANWFTEERIQKFGTAIANFHKGFGDILDVVRLILKAMAAWAAVTVGMSAAGVLGALIKNMRAVFTITKAILSVEKILLGLTKARAAIQAALATATRTGKPLLSLFTAGGVAAAVFVGLDKIINKAINSAQDFGKKFTESVDAELTKGDFGKIFKNTDFEIPELKIGEIKPPKAGEGGKVKKPQGMSDEMFDINKMINEATRQRNELLFVELQHAKDVLALHERKQAGLITEKKFRSELDTLETNVIAKREAAQDRHKAKQDALLVLENEFLTIQENIAVNMGTMTAEERDLNQFKRDNVGLADKFQILVDKGKIHAEDLAKVLANLPELLNDSTDSAYDFKKALQEMAEKALNLGENLERVAVEYIGKLSDTLADFVATGKANFNDFARSVLQDLSRIFMKFAIFKTLSLIPGMQFLTASAYGNAFDRNGIVPFARGGIVNSPTVSLMGEAGPEAVLPLKRGSDGRLGVAADGAMGGMIINVDVDATGSPKTSGNPGSAKALGDAIGAAVQQELIKQKRPGGLLAA